MDLHFPKFLPYATRRINSPMFILISNTLHSHPKKLFSNTNSHLLFKFFISFVYLHTKIQKKVCQQFDSKQ